MGAALLVLDVAGARLFDALAVSEQLFAGGIWGAVSAASTVLLVCGRITLCFVFPGYLVAALVLWVLGARRSCAEAASAEQFDSPSCSLHND